jgi:hypothetical protein
MRRNVIVACAFLLAAAICPRQAAAVSVNYDFSVMGYSDGQSLEGAVLGAVTFTSESGDLRYYSSYGGGIGTGYYYGATGDTYLHFSVPVYEVTFTGGDGAGDDDAFAATLYEFGTDNLIGTWSTPVFGGLNEPEWYTLPISYPNIGRVVFDPGNSGVLPGVWGPAAGGLVITEFGYSPVPEPASILLLGIGLAGLAAERFRRRRPL